MSKQRMGNKKRPSGPYHQLLITAARGTEKMLAQELKELNIGNKHKEVPGGITCRAPFKEAMKTCLWSRLANRALLELGHATISGQDELYEWIKSLEIERVLSPSETFAVRARAKDKHFKNTHFLALKVKDAIVDRARERLGSRPSVDTAKPNQRFLIHLFDNQARLYISISGNPLFQRGYRLANTRAPLKETLAAALLRFSKWDPQQPLHDPFCGSGTIPIEAAMIAANQAPGLKRDFAFRSWPIFDHRAQQHWEGLVGTAKGARLRSRVEIIGSDREAYAIRAARKNATQAGVTDSLRFFEADARTTQALQPPGHFIANLPYGTRIKGSEGGFIRLHERFVAQIRDYPNHTLTMLSTPKLLKQGVHLKPDQRLPIANGQIDCQMARYRFFNARSKG